VMNFYITPEFYIRRDHTELSGHVSVTGVLRDSSTSAG
jgi:hypothetical protein